MRFSTSVDPAEVRAAALRLVEQDPVRHTVFGSIADGVGHPDAAPWLALAEDDRNRVAARSNRTTPVALSAAWEAAGPARDAALDALVPLLLHLDPPLTAVTGPPRAVDAVAERLGVAGRPRTAEVAERLHRLDDLQPPRRKVAGAARRAGARDVGLVAQWYAQFFAEAFGHPLEDADASARHMLDGGGAVVLWEHGGEALSLAAARAPVFGVARIGPVYTPPDLRGRGYGSAVTAAATRLLLDAGAVPVLYTDLANPTSNAIYRALGYRPVCDWAMARFD